MGARVCVCVRVCEVGEVNARSCEWSVLPLPPSLVQLSLFSCCCRRHRHRHRCRSFYCACLLSAWVRELLYVHVRVMTGLVVISHKLWQSYKLTCWDMPMHDISRSKAFLDGRYQLGWLSNC